MAQQKAQWVQRSQVLGSRIQLWLMFPVSSEKWGFGQDRYLSCSLLWDRYEVINQQNLYTSFLKYWGFKDKWTKYFPLVFEEMSSSRGRKHSENLFLECYLGDGMTCTRDYRLQRQMKGGAFLPKWNLLCKHSGTKLWSIKEQMDPYQWASSWWLRW